MILIPQLVIIPVEIPQLLIEVIPAPIVILIVIPAPITHAAVARALAGVIIRVVEHLGVLDDHDLLLGRLRATLLVLDHPDAYLLGDLGRRAALAGLLANRLAEIKDQLAVLLDLLDQLSTRLNLDALLICLLVHLVRRAVHHEDMVVRVALIHGLLGLGLLALGRRAGEEVLAHRGVGRGVPQGIEEGEHGGDGG